MGMWKSLFTVLAVTSSMAAIGANPQSEGLTERIVETKPRDGVYHRSILSRKADGGEKWLVVSFPGHPGILRIRDQDGVPDYDLKGNFLVRARRHLVSPDIALATLDCPSDEFSACGDAYRDSERHVEDVLKQISALKSLLSPDIKVALVGTSYGTVSSELLAKKLVGKIDAAIHTASITRPRVGRGQPLLDVDLAKTEVRQLIVHHEEDPCRLTGFEPLKKYQGVVPMVIVKGSSNPRGDACEAYTQHGFVGRESVVMKAMAEWLLTNRVVSSIE